MMTQKQKLFYESVKEITSDQGKFPTIRQVIAYMGLTSTATAYAYLQRLADKGYLKKTGRSWQFPNLPSSVPLVGYVPAGNPHNIFEDLGEEVDLPEWMVDREGEISGFRVKGDSMIDAHIQDGDIVVIKKTTTAEQGEMVVAMLEDDSITLKRLKKGTNGYILVPENIEYPPITDPFKVVGKVVAVMRKYH